MISCRRPYFFVISGGLFSFFFFSLFLSFQILQLQIWSHETDTVDSIIGNNCPFLNNAFSWIQFCITRSMFSSSCPRKEKKTIFWNILTNFGMDARINIRASNLCEPLCSFLLLFCHCIYFLLFCLFFVCCFILFPTKTDGKYLTNLIQ